VTDNKSPGDRLLELVVFGPTGLAVTLVEEFPKFVEKGRHRVEGQVHTARLVGQFAFQMGRRQLEQSLGHLAAQSHGPPRDVGADAGDAAVDPEGRSHFEGRDDRESASEREGGHPVAPVGTAGAADHEPAAPPWRPSVWLGSGGPNGAGSSTSLAIPGYDSLSASQVVQRLEGLSPPELEEVRAHEAAHRQRRTILHRVEQLLSGGDSVPS
jgi:hypothetical protein